VKLLFPREPGQRLVRRKETKLAVNMLLASWPFPSPSSQKGSQVSKEIADPHCQFLTALEGGINTSNKHTALSLMLDQGKGKSLSLML
jgi:hypothetical protein